MEFELFRQSEGFIRDVPFKIVERENRPMIQMQHGGRQCEYAPWQVSTAVLARMKESAEQRMRQCPTDIVNVTNAMITVPAYFALAQKAETIKAAREVGFSGEVRLITEPAAAAIAYGSDKKMTNGYTMLVFDFGGGTFELYYRSLLNKNLLLNFFCHQPSSSDSGEERCVHGQGNWRGHQPGPIHSKDEFCVFGMLILDGLPKGMAGTVRIKKTLNLDKNGILSAVATCGNLRTECTINYYEAKSKSSKGIGEILNDAQLNNATDKLETRRRNAKMDFEGAIERALYNVKNFK